MAKFRLAQNYLACKIIFYEARRKYDRVDELRSIYLAKYDLGPFLTYALCRREEYRGDFEAAIKLCTRCLRTHPLELGVLHHLARYQTIIKDFDAAVNTSWEAYTVAVELNVPPFDYELELAHALKNAEKYESALQVIESAILHNPKSEYALSLRIWLNLVLQRFSEAKRYANEAKVLLPEWPEPDAHLGAGYLRLGKYRAAAEHFENYLSRCDGGRQVFEELAYCYEMLYEPVKVEQACRRGLQTHPESEKLWVILAWALIQMERTDDAKEALEKALSINPDSDDAHKLLAKIDDSTMR